MERFSMKSLVSIVPSVLILLASVLAAPAAPAQTAEDEAEMPIGCGEVDFRLLAEYVPSSAERVLEIGPRHGRAEILASVQYLADHGF